MDTLQRITFPSAAWPSPCRCKLLAVASRPASNTNDVKPQTKEPEAPAGRPSAAFAQLAVALASRPEQKCQRITPSLPLSLCIFLSRLTYPSFPLPRRIPLSLYLSESLSPSTSFSLPRHHLAVFGFEGGKGSKRDAKGGLLREINTPRCMAPPLQSHRPVRCPTFHWDSVYSASGWKLDSKQGKIEQNAMRRV